MIRIDLRYLAIVAAFYAPGLLVLIGAFTLGYSLNEVRDFVAFIGLFVGATIAFVVATSLFVRGKPLWFEIGLRK